MRLCFAAYTLVAALEAGGADAWPFPYNTSKFPVAWFGANATMWESEEQIEEIGKYSMAILGWQHLTDVTDFTAVVYNPCEASCL